MDGSPPGSNLCQGDLFGQALSGGSARHVRNLFARPPVHVAKPSGQLYALTRTANQRSATTMGKGKMNGDNSADSKKPASKARGSGGTMKNQNSGKQDNNKAANTKSNRQ